MTFFGLWPLNSSLSPFKLLPNSLDRNENFRRINVWLVDAEKKIKSVFRFFKLLRIEISHPVKLSTKQTKPFLGLGFENVWTDATENK